MYIFCAVDSKKQDRPMLYFLPHNALARSSV